MTIPPLLSLMLGALTGFMPQADAALATGPEPGRAQVFVLGMIHGGHRTSELWGLEEVRQTLVALDPDLICVEIPPDNWPGTLATWKRRGVVEDSRVRVFPEYVDVLMPLTDELRFEVAPCAGWTPEMARARSARIQRFNTSEEDAEARALQVADDRWTQAWLEQNPALGEADDPFYIHSPAYDLRTKVELGSYEHHLNEVIGWPGGWTYINHEHFALVREAILENPGKRIVVTFGAAHKYWFLEQLRGMPEVQLMDVRPFLPGASERPRRAEEAASEELLLGLDAMRAWWSDSRGTSEAAWGRLQAMLELEHQAELLKQLRATRGAQPSEFQLGPFFGALEVTSREGDAWSLRMEVRRLHDEPEQATWLTARLVPDENRPGGFAWTHLTLPPWLLAQRAR